MSEAIQGQGYKVTRSSLTSSWVEKPTKIEFLNYKLMDFDYLARKIAKFISWGVEFIYNSIEAIQGQGLTEKWW